MALDTTRLNNAAAVSNKVADLTLRMRLAENKDADTASILPIPAPLESCGAFRVAKSQEFQSRGGRVRDPLATKVLPISSTKLRNSACE